MLGVLALLGLVGLELGEGGGGLDDAGLPGPPVGRRIEAGALGELQGLDEAEGLGRMPLGSMMKTARTAAVSPAAGWIMP
ncbi:hypothetical protein TTMY_0447 [Thermus thermophilus]|nr:hypothetical protein TTMY_0447 [Thermus thermophilus]